MKDQHNCERPGCTQTGDSTCAGCLVTKYCTPECQRADWSRHKQTCVGQNPAPTKTETQSKGCCDSIKSNGSDGTSRKSGCANPKLGLEATTDCLILASLVVITIAVLQFVYFDYEEHQNSYTSAQLYSMVTILFAGLMFLLASCFLRSRVTGQDGDTLKSILKDNYTYTNDNDDKKDSRTWITLCCTANSFMVVGWLVFLGTVPLVLPLASSSIPLFQYYIVIGVALILILFIVATSPQCLKRNGGKGSVCCHDGKCCRPCGSDVLILLFILGFIGLLLVTSSIIYTIPNVKSVSAWLWLGASVFFTIGFLLWYFSSIPTDEEEDDDEQQVNHDEEAQTMLPQQTRI